MAADLNITLNGTPVPVYLGENTAEARRQAQLAAGFADAAEAAAEEAQLGLQHWLSPDHPPLTTSRLNAAKGIKKVQIVGATTAASRGDTYRITIIAKNDGTYADRLRVQNAANDALYTFDGTIAGKDDGPVWVKTASVAGVYFRLLIDYREYSNGIVLSDINSPLILSDQIFADEVLQDQVDSFATTIEAAGAPWRAADADTLTSDDERSILAAVQFVEAVGIDHSTDYRIVTVCRDHPTFGDRILIWDTGGNVWSNGSPTIPGKDDGPVWTTLTRVGEVGYFNLLIDYRKLTDANGDGLIFSNTNNTKFKLSGRPFQLEKVRDAIAAGEGSASSATVPGRALRVAVAGSSITWGQGWLSQGSYLATVDDWLRYQRAETRHGAQMTLSAGASTVSNPLFFRGSCTRLVGAAEKASFTMTGDEVSLCIARPRGSAGAAICELYIDGVLHDTFSTLGNPVTAHHASFVGNGSARKFDLGRAFTFDHVATVNGSPITVALNTNGDFGANDAIVIRALSGGEVHHFLYFQTPPANGAAIEVDFNAGESVTYTKSYVGQIDEALTSANESPYGDGAIAFDPDAPSALSSGLGFRGTDERSILTWRFNTVATRQIEVRVKELDPAGTGTPELWLNFATNRMHRLMNAGIGGFDAGELRDDTGVNGMDELLLFQPDIVAFEFATNDDWTEHVYRAWQTRTGLTAADVQGVETAHYFADVTKIGTDNYTVNDQRLPITAITPTSVTFTATDTTFNIVPDDVIIFGDFFGDNRRLACRVVKTWDAGTRTATWGRPLRADEMAGISDLSEIATARVFGSPGWVGDMGDLIDLTREALPNAQIAIGTSGIPNIRHRRLEGYRELAEAICADKGVTFFDFYGQTLEWQYSQPATVQMYIDAANGTTADGSATYTLYNAGGTLPNTLSTANWLYRNWSVLVDGVERINRGCHVIGGYKEGWAVSTDPMTKANTEGVGDNYVLTFTDDVPAPGAEIIVKRAAEKWANDDCHPGDPGKPVMGYAVNAALAHMVEKAAAMPGRK